MDHLDLESKRINFNFIFTKQFQDFFNAYVKHKDKMEVTKIVEKINNDIVLDHLVKFDFSPGSKFRKKIRDLVFKNMIKEDDSLLFLYIDDLFAALIYQVANFVELVQKNELNFQNKDFFKK